MATTLSGSIRAQVAMKLNAGDSSLSDDQIKADEAFSTNYTNGTGSGQADLMYNVRGSLAASGTDTYDLDAGTLTDRYGNALTFVKVKSIVVSHTSTSSASSISMAGDFTTTHSLPQQAIVAGGHTEASDPTGYTVTATTADVITIVNADGSNVATYDLYIIGTSA
jgi:hypothetical protein